MRDVPQEFSRTQRYSLARTVTAWALTLLSAASVALGDRCEEQEDPHWQAELDRIWQKLDDEIDANRLRSRARVQLPALSGSVDILATDQSAHLVSTTRRLLERANQHLQEIEVTSNQPSTIEILLTEVNSPATTQSSDSRAPRAYGLQNCHAGLRDCYYIVFLEGWRSADDFEHITAHEFFHLAQQLALPEVRACEAAWWFEGTAEWFANRVVPGSDWSYQYLQLFDRTSATTSLVDMTYDALAFFLWLDTTTKDPLAFAALGDEGLSDARRVGSVLPAETWQDFLETYLSGRLRFPDGRAAIESPNLGQLVAPSAQLYGPALSFPRARLELTLPGTWRLEASGNEAGVSVRPDGQDWVRLDVGTPSALNQLEVEADCPDPLRVVTAAVSPSQRVFDVTVDAHPPDSTGCKCKKPVPSDHCLIGSWRATSTNLPSGFNQAQASQDGPSRWTGQRMGANRITLRADGTFEQAFDGTRSGFQHQQGAVNLTQTVQVNNTMKGRWSSSGDGNLEICRNEISGQIVNQLRAGARQASHTIELPYDAVREAEGVDYEYVCDGGHATVTMKLGGTTFAGWEMVRLAPGSP